MKNYADRLEENLKQLGYDSSKTNLQNFYLTKTQICNLNNTGTGTSLYDLVSIRNKIRYQWWGFTYFFVDKHLGVDTEAYYQIGYSTVPYPKRLNWYLKIMIEDPTKRTFYRTGEKQIYGWIYDYLDKEFGMDFFRMVDGNLDIKLIREKVAERFEFRIIAVFWSEAATKQSETELIEMGKYDIENLEFLNERINRIIEKYQLDSKFVGKALNDPNAAGSGGNSNQFTVIIAYYVSLDYSIRQIHDVLTRYYNYRKAYTTFIFHFNSHFISVQNARKLFLRPILVSLVRAGFNRNKINDTYGKNMDHRFKELFSGRLYLDLKAMSNSNVFDLENKSPRGYFDKELQEKLHPEHHIRDYISFLNGDISYSSFDWSIVGNELMAAYIIDQLKTINPNNNLISEYSEIAFKLHYKRDYDSLSQELFTGFKMRDLHYWLVNHPTIVTIHDFNDVFNFERSILPPVTEIIPLGVLKEMVILKYNNLKFAANNNDVFSDRMTINSFFYYYSDWDTARQEVCGPIIIQMLKNGEDLSKILKLIGEIDQSMIMKWFFNLDLSSIKNILDYFRNIKTIGDFERAYLDLDS